MSQLRISDCGLEIADPMPRARSTAQSPTSLRNTGRRARPSAIRSPQSAIRRVDWSSVRLFAMDVDGVLTDGTVSICSDGSESKSFSILDGHGLKQLAKAGIAVAWISGRASGATTARATELKIPHVIQGRTDKITALQELAARLGFSAAQCAYMGDDVIDAPAIAWAGVGVAPPTAMETAINAATYVTRRPAGFGAVREVCDRILAAAAVKPGNSAPKRSSNPR